MAPSTVDHEQFDGFIRFLSDEWTGARPHSYQVPTKGRSSTWSKSLDPVGNWSTRGLKNAFEKYNWNGKTFSENKAQLDNLALELQSAITASDNPKVNDTALAIMSWGGVNNKHRQRRTKKWLSDNNRCLSEKIKKAVSLLHIETEPLLPFDGTELIMNSAVTKIISLADPNNKLIIYDGRVGSALGHFASLYAREKLASPLAPSLRFAVDTTHPKDGPMRRNPSDEIISFPSLFGSKKDKQHAEMMRLASKLIEQVAQKCGCSSREIEAGLFMWGYSVIDSANQR
ncbi:hypothetical protein [Rhodopseudomonas palustris]|uniref:Uncharacterized protein n=1 Tax=Rhodopseudomonas palustris (strain ATCC BAA-98 / CGA009) TaxID=258594 RepID=A0AAE9Y4S3_RHOPA|nr:hypothetical protein [Rhodopseudomonas palustris]WAB77288.1 hypothetical protein OR798_22790 [Rhodopseudomonas palustris]WCL94592.1 hypothetical protein TX73_022785 [Rhodopseudomonas palustris CGA009]WND51200.1 hypothetical protein L1A21_22710 [Rhodopseudomonas palustris]